MYQGPLKATENFLKSSRALYNCLKHYKIFAKTITKKQTTSIPFRKLSLGRRV